MFIRPCYRRKNGKRHAYWALMESYRTERGPRQRVVAYLGQLDEPHRLGVQQAAEGKQGTHQKRLFDETRPSWVEVDVKRVRVENRRDFGGPWLGLELIDQLGLKEFLDRTISTGREKIPWSLMALILVLSRLCDPSSELHIAEHFYGQSALPDLLGVPSEKINEQRLYRALDALLPYKESLEHRYGRADRIWVGDRGMVSANNIAFLKQSGRRYIVGTPKSMLKQFERELLADDWHAIRDGLEVKLCPAPDGNETFVLCRSRDRCEKEKAMHGRFEQRIEEGLRRIEVSCQKQRLTPVVVAQRLGRLLGENSRAAGLFHTEIQTAADGRVILHWKKIDAWRDWAALSEGCYLLRSNVMNWSDEELWKAYIQLTEAEAAFRIHKSDLGLRPVWHQKEDRVLAHILVCFLAYVLWKTLSQRCQRAGLGHEPRRVFEELSKIQLVDVVLPTRQGTEIRQRCITQPTDHQAILLTHLHIHLPSLRLTEGV
jgi:hypothetical protein